MKYDRKAPHRPYGKRRKEREAIAEVLDTAKAAAMMQPTKPAVEAIAEIAVAVADIFARNDPSFDADAFFEQASIRASDFNQGRPARHSIP